MPISLLSDAQISALRSRVGEWIEGDVSDEDRATLQRLVDGEKWDELQTRFSGDLRFGTAGIRAPMGPGPLRMNSAVARRLAYALARYLEAFAPAEASPVVVGRDARMRSEEFARDVAGVLVGMGRRVIWLDDPQPTPLVAYAARMRNAAAAVVVTASHNPKQDNGLKVYWSGGSLLSSPHDALIAQTMALAPAAREVPWVDISAASAQPYVERPQGQLVASYLDAIAPIERETPQRSLRIVYSAMHGVGGRLAVSALCRTGFASVLPVASQHEPDGNFPSVSSPNPEHPAALDAALALAQETGAHLVLVNDPDADRLAVAAKDATGSWRRLSGDDVGALLGDSLLSQCTQPSSAFVLTTMVSSSQLASVATLHGADYGETMTGFKHLMAEAGRRRESGEKLVFAYEEALGYACSEAVRDKDGISAAVVFATIADACHRQGRSVWDLVDDLAVRTGVYLTSQVTVDLAAPTIAAAVQLAVASLRAHPPAFVAGVKVVGITDYLQGDVNAEDVQVTRTDMVKLELDDRSRIIVRPSGTEPKLKVYLQVVEPPKNGADLATAQGRAAQRMRVLREAAEKLVLAPHE